MREYHNLRTSIAATLENTEAVADIGSALKDHEETKKSLAKVRIMTFISVLV